MSYSYGAKPSEAREMSKLEGLRARAAERRERFLASGKESYGGAVDAWEGQAQERVERRTAYKKADTRDARDQARVAVMLALEEEEAKAEERERRAAQRSAWQVQLDEKAYAAEREREFDAKLHRELVDDRTAGLSSMRKFAGCDTEADVRKRLQAEQMRRWLDAQAQITSAKKAAAVEEDRQWAESNKQLYELRTEIEEQRAAAERASKRDQYRFAQEATEAKAQRVAAQRATEMAANARDIASNLAFIDRLENPVGSALGAHRVRSDHYRGATSAMAADRDRVRAQQLADAEIAAKAAAQEESRRAREERRMLAYIQQRDALAEEERKLRDREEYRRDLEAQILAKEQADAAAKAERSAQGFSEGFFGAFGRSDR